MNQSDTEYTRGSSTTEHIYSEKKVSDIMGNILGGFVTNSDAIRIGVLST